MTRSDRLLYLSRRDVEAVALPLFETHGFSEVTVEEIPGNPGYYFSKIFLRPHYQLEGLTVSLRLVSKLPSQKAA